MDRENIVKFNAKQARDPHGQGICKPIGRIEAYLLAVRGHSLKIAD